MFGFRKRDVATNAAVLDRTSSSVLSVSAPQPESVAVVDMPDGLTDEYVKLAARLGIVGPKLELEARQKSVLFTQFLSESGISCYDRERVAAYLDSQYKTTPWGWRAVREKDNPVSTVIGFGSHRIEGHWMASDGTIDNSMEKWRKRNNILIGGDDARLYAKPIPLPVLYTMKNISERFPEATFWISDDVAAQPIPKDPFLMVRYAGLELVIERWDEPGFKL